MMIGSRDRDYTKLLWSYTDDYKTTLFFERNVSGEYIITVTNNENNTRGQLTLPGAKCDELRLAMLPGFDPTRVNPRAVVTALAADHTSC